MLHIKSAILGPLITRDRTAAVRYHGCIHGVAHESFINGDIEDLTKPYVTNDMIWARAPYRLYASNSMIDTHAIRLDSISSR